MSDARAERDIPDPLRSLKVGDVVSITDNPAFQKPEGIDEEQWVAAVEEVRGAVRILKLDVPIDARDKVFLPGLCKGVDRNIRGYNGEEPIDKPRAHDPVIDAVRNQIGLFVTVRIRLGRNEKFQQLIGILKAQSGIASFADLERQGLRSLVAVMRNIVQQADDANIKREAMWGYIKEFLAEQAGIAKVDFPDQKATEERPEAIFKRRAADLGLEFTHLDELERDGQTFDMLLEGSAKNIEEHLAAIDGFLRELTPALERVRATERRTSGAMQEMESGDLKEYKRRKGELDRAKSDLLEALGEIALSPADARAYKKNLAALEEEFAEPLRGYRQIEDENRQAAESIEVLETLREELRDKQKQLGELLILLKKAAGNGDQGVPPNPRPRAAARPAAAAAAVPARSDGAPAVTDGRFIGGQAVEHKTFGRGTVLRVGGERSTVVEVQFDRDGVGVKQIDVGRGNFLTPIQ